LLKLRRYGFHILDDIAEIEALWLSHIGIWGTRFTSVFFIFSIMAGWIAEMLFMLFFAYIAV